MNEKKPEDTPSTHLASNILLAVLCFPPFLALALFLYLTLGYPESWVLYVALLFLFIGGLIPVLVARRIQNRLAAGYPEDGHRLSSACRKAYRWGAVLCWLGGIFLAIALPGHHSYRERAYAVQAEKVSQALETAQAQYHEVNRSYCEDLGKLPGWSNPPVVEVTLLSADKRCWSAMFVVNGGSRRYRYDHCGKGFQQVNTPERKP